MTVLGAIIAPDRAVLWCDTEIYSEGRPIGEGAKMALNPLGIAVVGTGSVPLIREGARAVQASASIDRAERRMAAELRIRAGRLAPRMVRKDATWFSGNVLVAAGFSPQAGRFVGWQFDSAAFFEPVLVSRFCLPADAEIDSQLRGVDSLDKVVGLARRQIALLRTGLPGATGGSLLIAELWQGGMHCQKIPDFDVGLAVAPSLPGVAVSVASAEAVPADSNGIGG